MSHTYSIIKYADRFDFCDYHIYEREKGILSLFTYYSDDTLVSWDKDRLLSGDFNCVTYLDSNSKTILANPNVVITLGKCIRKLIEASVRIWGDVPNFNLQGMPLK